MNRIDLINLIREHLQKTGNTRIDNYKDYTLKDLIKTCQIYNISLPYSNGI